MTEKMREQKNDDQGGHVPHGGRSDLEPVASSSASHVGSCGWLPIETAPTDGTVVLLAATLRGQRVTGYGFWYRSGYVGANWVISNMPNAHQCLDSPEVATHWMPLPDPPVVQTRRREEEKDHNAALPPVDPISEVQTETLPNEADYGTSLDVTIERGALVIRIGVQTLAHAVTYSDWANRWDEKADDYIRDFAITDVAQFAKDVASAMQREEEDGSSLLTHFLDKATESAVNDGSLGLDVEEHKIKHGEKSPLETW